MIIAEAGIWHQGDMAKAMNLVIRAYEAGADAIKFQIFQDGDLFCPMPGDHDRKLAWEKSEMTLRKWRKVRAYASGCGIKFGASIFQDSGVELLKKLNPDFIKVASRAAETFPYKEFDGPFIISMGLMEEGWVPINIPDNSKHLQCKMEYPTPLPKARWIGYDGLSDHSGNPYVAIDALARGAEIIEVHFCLAHEEGRPDDKVSLLPHELKMICEARDVFRRMK